MLSDYVNRKGIELNRELTPAGHALLLLLKSDGTTMGQKLINGKNTPNTLSISEETLRRAVLPDTLPVRYRYAELCLQEHFMPKPAFHEILPEAAAEIEALLKNRKLYDLADQIPTLKIVDRCRCDQPTCSGFFTAPRPDKKPDPNWGPGHKKINLTSNFGLDVVDRKITFIEILDRDDIRSILHAAIP
jgi:hypothetical protein